ncbi:hypothetical protein [Photobacterium nomapromontoriensis]|uniref:hypothetical protein n=1 Tax=Photobacterium nomapromontoriensis TaxID=2910237 RepID=UPI003D13530C
MQAVNDFHANLELQHIYLEAYSERYHSLRQYFESYYCYRHNLITRQSKPDWEQIFTVAPHSLEALSCADRKQTVRELMLPLVVLIGKLKVLVRDEQLTLASIQALLDAELDYVILSRSQWQQLKKEGLLERMPAAFYQPDSPYYRDSLCRFTLANIQF